MFGANAAIGALSDLLAGKVKLPNVAPVTGEDLAEILPASVVQSRLRKMLSTEDVTALKRFRELLAEDKFGGKDRKITAADLRDIKAALLKDPEVHAQIVAGIHAAKDHKVQFRRSGRERWEIGKRHGERKAPGVLEANWDSYWATGVARAGARIDGEFTQALRENGLSVVPNGHSEKTARNVTMADVRELRSLATRLGSVREKLAQVSGRKSEGTLADIDKVLGLLGEA